MQATLATLETLFDLAWYPDSGATTRLTLDAANVLVKTKKYGGHEKVQIGNGTSLVIKHITFVSLILYTRVNRVPNTF